MILLCPCLTLSAQDAVIWFIPIICSLEDPSGDIQNPNILDPSWGESISISFPHFCDGSVSVSSLSYSHHFPSGLHLKSIIYYFVIYELTCPPVALSAPVNILRPFFAIFTASSRGGSIEGDNSMIVESSTKQYPNRRKEPRKILHLKITPCPASTYKEGANNVPYFWGCPISLA